MSRLKYKIINLPIIKQVYNCYKELKYIKYEHIYQDMEDDYIDEIYGGEESTFHESIRFVCDSDFSKESIDEKYHAAAIGKGEKEYYRITNNFITVERLKELYENGLELSECINEEVKNTT